MEVIIGAIILVAILGALVKSGQSTAKGRSHPPPAITPKRPIAPTQSAAKPAAPSYCPDNPIIGTAYVIDGDTIIINKTRIRLFGIDAPEMDHPYGAKSKWAMVALCKGQKVTAVPDGSLSHDRCVARCFLPDGRDLSAELVKQGLAIDWPKFSAGEYRRFEPDGVRRKLWRAHNRQTGRYVPPAQPRA